MSSINVNILDTFEDIFEETFNKDDKNISTIGAKTNPSIKSNTEFNYKTTLFIGNVDSQIRVWLDRVNDTDSLVVLNGAIDSFFSKVKDYYFIFTVKRGPTNENDVIDVRGKIESFELIDIRNPTEKTKIEMTLKFKSHISGASLEREIRNFCYFYLNGEIEGETYTDKKYNPTMDVFEEHPDNIITAATFTTLSVYCERRDTVQELLIATPF